MKKLILILLTFSAISTQAQKAELYAYNIAFYTTSAIIRSAIKKEPLKTNLIKGFAAGNVSYFSKQIKTPLISRAAHSMAPYIMTGQHNIDFFMFTINQGSIKINVSSVYGIIKYASAGGKIDFKQSLKHGSTVFSINEFNGLYGQEIGNTFVYKKRKGQNSTIRHEFIHTLQSNEYMILNPVKFRFIEYENPLQVIMYNIDKTIFEKEAKAF